MSRTLDGVFDDLIYLFFMMLVMVTRAWSMLGKHSSA